MTTVELILKNGFLFQLFIIIKQTNFSRMDYWVEMKITEIIQDSFSISFLQREIFNAQIDFI